MLIALLAVLGVDLVVIVVVLAVMLTRRRWVSHQPGARFECRFPSRIIPPG